MLTLCYPGKKHRSSTLNRVPLREEISQPEGLLREKAEMLTSEGDYGAGPSTDFLIVESKDSTSKGLENTAAIAFEMPDSAANLSR